MRLFLPVICLAVSLQAFAQQKTDTLTNAIVIELHAAHLGSETIRAKIQASSCKFDLSTDGLISLKKAGVPDEVITAMFTAGTPANKPPVSTDKYTLSPGIYYIEPSGKLVEMESTTLSNTKAGGAGEFLKRSVTYGLANSKMRATLDGSRAQLQLNKNTVFVFVFDTSSRTFNNNPWNAAQSPKDFFLVQFEQVKNTRELVTFKGNAINYSFGVDEKSKLTFNVQRIRKGIYEVRPSPQPEPGEYGFMFAAGSMYAGWANRIFDFGVD